VSFIVTFLMLTLLCYFSDVW